MNEKPLVLKKATLGGGCFWCLEAAYQKVRGVKKVVSGYAGGHTKNPEYQEVCSGITGHAEVIQIDYDENILSYEDLLAIFWKIHDPTQKDGQGGDLGTQYRSVILYHKEDQKSAAEKSIAEHALNFARPIVTELNPLTIFYKAEKNHQNYYNTNPDQPYCSSVISPKLLKMEKNLGDFLA
ncbi:MAG: peptide-methionine (S)-S-oxide reductase MsrA [Leptospirales bacterium]